LRYQCGFPPSLTGAEEYPKEEITAAKIAEIASATVQQGANAKEVSKAIQSVAQVTEQTPRAARKWPPAAKSSAHKPRRSAR
jgi:hypothetical protein